MLKSVLILTVFMLVMIFGVSVVSAQQTLSTDCDPYHLGQSDLSFDTSILNTPATDADAAATNRLGINPQVLVKLADNMGGAELPVADFANPDAQLKENAFAVVTPDSDSLNLYAGTCLEAPVLAHFQPGTQVTVLDGPIASDGLAWWRVRRSDLTGWVIEGMDNEIWLHG